MRMHMYSASKTSSASKQILHAYACTQAACTIASLSSNCNCMRNCKQQLQAEIASSNCKQKLHAAILILIAIAIASLIISSASSSKQILQRSVQAAIAINMASLSSNFNCKRMRTAIASLSSKQQLQAAIARRNCKQR